ncbi:MAG: SEL1-like repeat protein [Clostridia bacterium]|nr:SEL1-like repeat protein [Clostridia bacterium]
MKCINCGHEWTADPGERIVACPGCGLEAEYLRDDTAHERAIEAERTGKYAEALALYKASADAGVPCASLGAYRCLSRLARDGSAGTQMVAEADFWLRTAAEERDPIACFTLSRRLEKAGLEQAMMHFLQQSAEAGHESACFKMARCARRGGHPAYAAFYLKRISDTNRRARLALFFLGRAAEEAEPARVPLPGAVDYYLKLADAAEEYHVPHVAYRHLLAAGDDPRALFRRVCMDRDGTGAERAFEAWASDLERAGDAGYTQAYVLLADMYGAGEFVARDPHRARDLYAKAAHAGDASAARTLADAYVDGTLGEYNVERAVTYYRLAAGAGDPTAAGRAEDIAAALAQARRKAEDAIAAGRPDVAYSLYVRLAERGHADSACAAAEMALQGQGTRRSCKTAAQYYERAVMGGSTRGVLGLGLLYAENLGVRFSYTKAQRLLAVAADHGHPAARSVMDRLRESRRARLTRRVYATGCALYHKGRVADAVRFFMTAARLGSARAMFRLGCHAEFGEGVRQSDQTAAAWYKRAADAGCAGEGGRLKSGFLLERKHLREMLAAQAESRGPLKESAAPATGRSAEAPTDPPGEVSIGVPAGAVSAGADERPAEA